MNRIRHKDNDLRQLGYFGRLNFILTPGEMVKILFSSLPGVMLKKIFGKQGLLKIFNLFAVPGEEIIFSGLTSLIIIFVLGIAGRIKFFIFSGSRAKLKIFYPSVAQQVYKIQYSR